MASMLKRVFCALESNNVEFLISTRNELIEKFGTLQKLSDGDFSSRIGNTLHRNFSVEYIPDEARKKSLIALR